MPSPTTRIRAQKQDPGGNLNTWGALLNTTGLDMLDEAVAGVETIALTGADRTLTSTNYATDEARNIGLRFTGTGGCAVIIPSVEKVYAARNDTTGNVTIRTSGGTGVTIGAGAGAVIQCDGTDCRLAARTDFEPTVAAAFSATSTTSLVIGTGSRTFTLAETDRAFAVGMRVRAADNAAPATNYMDGTVTAYSGTTLTVLMDATAGSGTIANWTVSFAQAQVGLPAQSGNSGRYLTTNGTTPSWGAIDLLGGAGSAAITTATTLVASSERVRPVAMTTDAQSVTLPNATALSEGGPLFVLPNTGSRPFGVRDSTGTLLAAVPAGGVAECYLRDNATAAGAWTVTGRDLQPALTLGDFTLANTLTQNVDASVRLTDNLSLHFARNASGHPFVFAVDSTPGAAAIGTPVLIVASSASVEHAFRISATKAMFKIAGTSSNVFNVTVSGVVCTVSSAATAAAFDQATFTGAPLIAALGANADLFVALDSGGAGVNITAVAVDCASANPSAGSAVNVSTTVTNAGRAVGLFRASNTTAIAIYIDDSGTAGAPFSLRAVVLSLSGTTITVGTPAGLNDTQPSAPSDGLPVCQLSATSYVVSYVDNSTGDYAAVHIGVSGTTVTFGAPLIVEVGTFDTSLRGYSALQANRFHPSLFPLTATTALLTYAGPTAASDPVRHVVLTNSGGTLTAGTILYDLWRGADGGNFPQAADGFIAVQETSVSARVSNVTISGTTLTVTGTFLPPGVVFSESEGNRFGLSGGIRAIWQGYQNGPAISAPSMHNAFRLTQGAGPRYLGAFNVPNFNGAQPPLEVAANKAVLTSSSLSQSGSATALLKVAIVEFAA